MSCVPQTFSSVSDQWSTALLTNIEYLSLTWTCLTPGSHSTDATISWTHSPPRSSRRWPLRIRNWHWRETKLDSLVWHLIISWALQPSVPRTRKTSMLVSIFRSAKMHYHHITLYWHDHGLSHNLIHVQLITNLQATSYPSYLQPVCLSPRQIILTLSSKCFVATYNLWFAALFFSFLIKHLTTHNSHST